MSKPGLLSLEKRQEVANFTSSASVLCHKTRHERASILSAESNNIRGRRGGCSGGWQLQL